MYKPVRPRPKKTDIVRSRGGCKVCRERRTKCDEKKPCGTCIRLGKVCESIKSDFKFRMVTGPGSDTTSPKDTSSPQTEYDSTKRDIVHTSPNRAISPSLDIIRSLQHTERDVFYSTYWEDKCLPALHPVFKSATLLNKTSPMLTNAILALSSCNMSRLFAERRDSSMKHMGVYSPGLVHQTRSQLYYSQAIQSLASLKQIENSSNFRTVFTVSVLFAYIESSMGNFQGFNCHVQGLLKFLSEVQDNPEDPELHEILTAWMQIRFVVWWARVYFSPLEVHRNIPPVLLPGSIDGSLETTEERRVNVLNIMCESHRLNCNHILKYWVCSPNPDDDEVTYYKLNEQAKKLDSWLLHLPITEQPSELHMQTQVFQETEWNNPILFQSHDAALNFAYYVLARIMQCTGAISRLRNRSFHRDHNPSEEQSWTRLLLQIAKGTDMQTSVSKNSYTIGFSGLLLAALLRCQDLSLGLEIQNWLEALHNLQPTEEGAFPIYQTLGVANMVNHQRSMGREIYGVSQLEDDGGGFPKFTAYNSQSISSLLLHGVCKTSGEIFTECVSIEV